MSEVEENPDAIRMPEGYDPFPDAPRYEVEYVPKYGKPGYAVFRIDPKTMRFKKVGSWEERWAADSVAKALNAVRGREM